MFDNIGGKIKTLAVSTHPAPSGTVTPVHDRTTDEVMCPNCGTRQKGNRRVCWSCGQEFTKQTKRTEF